MVSSHVDQPNEQRAERMLKQFLEVGRQASLIASVVIARVQQERLDNLASGVEQSSELPQPHQNGDDHHAAE